MMLEEYQIKFYVNFLASHRTPERYALFDADMAEAALEGF